MILGCCVFFLEDLQEKKIVKGIKWSHFFLSYFLFPLEKCNRDVPGVR